MGGGVRPPRVTEERKPECCSARRSVRWRLVAGTEVRPSRALEAFCRCEQTCERFTRDMVRGVEGAMSPRGLWGVFTSCGMGGTGYRQRGQRKASVERSLYLQRQRDDIAAEPWVKFNRRGCALNSAFDVPAQNIISRCRCGGLILMSYI